MHINRALPEGIPTISRHMRVFTMSNAALAVQPVAQALDIHPVAGRIGAEIRGIKLSGDLDAATVDAIQQALVQYKVIFFREQTHLDDQSQEAFAHLLGEPIAHPTVPVRDGTRFLLELDGTRGQRANSWHTDVTFVDAYPKASILRSVLAPKSGGDTVWANTSSAYNDLSVELRALADTLWAIHSNEYDYAGRKPDVSVEKLEEYRKVFTSTVYETEHPVVRVHPVSGEKPCCWGTSSSASKAIPRRTRRSCSTCCKATSPAWKTPCAGAGMPATWRSGTTAPPSITRWMTTAPRNASCAG